MAPPGATPWDDHAAHGTDHGTNHGMITHPMSRLHRPRNLTHPMEPLTAPTAGRIGAYRLT